MHRHEAGGRDQVSQFAPAKRQQGPDHRHRAAGHEARFAHPGQAGQAAAAVEPHQQRLGLVVGMVRGEDRRKVALPGPVGQRSVACLARFALQVAAGDGDFEDRAGNAARRACLGHHRAFARAFRPQAVVDGGHFEPAWHGRLGEQQHRQAVGTAGYRKPQPPAIGPQPRQGLGEARYQLRRRVRRGR